jgi:hypothetical protein
MTVYFSQGPAISREPTIEDVLDCLVLDASGADSFEDWCAEFGYDTERSTPTRSSASRLKSSPAF